jgi:hypothetical protein
MQVPNIECGVRNALFFRDKRCLGVPRPSLLEIRHKDSPTLGRIIPLAFPWSGKHFPSVLEDFFPTRRRFMGKFTGEKTFSLSALRLLVLLL